MLDAISPCGWVWVWMSSAGDPLIVHSCSIVLVVPYKQRMPLTQLVAAGRLACKAKKTVVLASYLQHSDDVRLVSFQWSGIS